MAKLVPHGFKQCVVIMAYDPTVGCNIPCVWALLTGKDQKLYKYLLSELSILLDDRWMPRYCICDFEKGLLNAIRCKFPETIIRGCYFHFRQALDRMMNKYKISNDERAICNNQLEFLTLVSERHILPKNKFNRLKMERILELFEKTWMKRFPSDLWNTSSIDHKSMKARTNNCLERYNRGINEQFTNPHPNIQQFIDVLKKEESYYASLCRNIRSGALKRELVPCVEKRNISEELIAYLQEFNPE
ncbi:hypothetical protein RF11_13230 [Thelohanellus kitauei]|uniref:MULE transposase domain-containing protein n=1 Tax=Thelohanellus kitauei TaxID=669202 RepID=A0A0C2MC13_THEKT|nr:hypothetical protein RF11_13230 [Thelohanellus kitauei]